MALRTTFRNKKLSASSKNWLKRHFSDPYVQQAKREGYRSRAAYKIRDIQEKYKLFKPGQVVVDLGAAPGGWSQIVAELTGSPGKGRVIALDLLDMDPLTGVEFLQGDFMDDAVVSQLREMVGVDPNPGVDGVISDMAPNTIGHRQTDHIRLVALVSQALRFATKVLKPGGFFVAKLFEGGAQNDLLQNLKLSFDRVRHIKPQSSRRGSSEMYVVAEKFRGESHHHPKDRNTCM